MTAGFVLARNSQCPPRVDSLMPQAADLQTHVLRARLIAARGMPAEKATQLLQSLIDRDEWANAPDEFCDALHVTLEGIGEGGAALVDGFAEAVAKRDLDDEARVALGRLLTSSSATQRAKEIALTRLLDVGKPNDAARVADALDARRLLHAVRVSPELHLRAAEWLLKTGAGELLSGVRAGLAVDLALYFGRQGRLDQCRVALRIALANDVPLANGYSINVTELLDLLGWVRASTSDEAAWLLSVLEKAPEGVARQLMHDLLVAGPTGEREGRLTSDLLGLLVAGRLPRPLTVSAWVAVFLSEVAPPDGAEISDGFTAQAGLETLGTIACGNEPLSHQPVQLTESAALEAWARMLCRRMLLLDLGRLARAQFGNAVGRCPSVAQGAKRALVEAFGPDGALADHPGRTVANELLEYAPEKHAVLGLLEIAMAPWERQGTAAAPFIPEDASSRLETLLPQLTLGPAAGFDFRSLLRPAKRVRFAELKDQAKVEIVGDELLVDPSWLPGLFNLGLGTREAFALLELCVAHEVVHLAQQIGDKRAVEAMRRSGRGGETTLMHLDLSADHVAAVALEAARYPGELEWLKDIQGQSILGFPSGVEHSAASRYRKSLRLLSLRADLMTRRSGLLRSPPAAAYVFVDFNPVGGVFNVLVNGPPMTLLKAVPIVAGVAQQLADCVHPHADLKVTDSMLAPLLAS